MGEGLGGHARGRAASVALLLGLLLLVAAPILRFWVTPALAQSPQVPGGGQLVTFTTTGTITTLFDLESAEATPNAEPLAVTRVLSSRADAGAAQTAEEQGLNVAVVDTLDRISTADATTIRQSQYRLAADRHSQALVDCCGTQVGGTQIPVAGAGNPLRFPWFTPPAAYPYLDTTLMAPIDMKYIGTEAVGDIDAMKFQQGVPPTALGTVEVPGALVSSEQPTVQLTRSYSANNTLWVDPTTGVILRSAERVRETLRDDAGKDVVTLLVMSLASTPEQQDTQLAIAHEQGRPVLWAHTYAPLICFGVGALLTLLGLLGIAARIRARRAEADFPDDWSSFDDLREAFD